MPTEMPDAGGEAELQGKYTILASASTVELEGATNVRDVQEVTLRAEPSNVIFHLRFLPEVYTPPNVANLSSAFAGYFNALAAIPGVASVSTFQDIDLADQLQDVMRIVVQSTSKVTSFPIEETQFGRRLDYLAEEIAAKVHELDTIEAGH